MGEEEGDAKRSDAKEVQGVGEGGLRRTFIMYFFIAVKIIISHAIFPLHNISILKYFDKSVTVGWVTC